MSDKLELTPCPFCGAKGFVLFSTYINIYKEKMWHIGCENCGLVFGGDHFKKNGKIIWNTRPTEDALRIRAEKAEADVSRLEDENYELSYAHARTFHAEQMIDRFVEAGNDLGTYQYDIEKIGAWQDLVAEYRAWRTDRK